MPSTIKLQDATNNSMDALFKTMNTNTAKETVNPASTVVTEKIPNAAAFGIFSVTTVEAGFTVSFAVFVFIVLKSASIELLVASCSLIVDGIFYPPTLFEIFSLLRYLQELQSLLVFQSLFLNMPEPECSSAELS